MTSIPVIHAPDIEGRLQWQQVVDALEAGHRRPPATQGDQFLNRGPDTLLSRAAWIDGLGVGVKSVTVVPGNKARELPSVHGAMVLFDDSTGQVRAVIDSAVVTWWKTAADSVLGARFLARRDSRTLLIVGAGTVAKSLVSAYRAIFPGLSRILIWNRTPATAQALVACLAGQYEGLECTDDLPAAVAESDIICTATMASEPVLKGEWVKPGTHVDLIGAFTVSMREADDALLQRGRLFVDSYDSTIGHIGELMIPLASGALRREDVLGDLYALVAGGLGREQPGEITVFKNGGGAHLDLMTAQVILAATGVN